MICVTIPGATYEKVYEQIQQAIEHAHLVELRLDNFESIDLEQLKKIQNTFLIPFLLTLKSTSQGGNYQGTESQRIAVLRNLAKLKPNYLDLESDLPVEFIEEIAQSHPEIKLILSYHHMTETPLDLTPIYHLMRRKPAMLYKIAVQANSTLDALRLVAWARETDKKILPISMGTYGQITRILAPVFENSFTYACLDLQRSTACGQLTPQTLINCYSYGKLHSQTALLGLIGDPVDQSPSHLTHNDYFRQNGLEAVYVKMNVKVEEISEFLKLAKKLSFRGLSVTMPLKEAILPYLDWMDPHVQQIGACNTVVFEEGRIKGYNTDAAGALNVIERHGLVRGKRMVIIGAGGAAKAIIYEACRRGAKVMILNRDAKRAQQVAAQWGCEGKGIEAMVDCFKKGYEILVNATSVDLPIDINHIFPGSLVMDIKTKALDTTLLKTARQSGCQIVYGHEMFIEQALGQFSLWFENKIDFRNIKSDLKIKN